MSHPPIIFIDHHSSVTADFFFQMNSFFVLFFSSLINMGMLLMKNEMEEETQMIPTTVSPALTPESAESIVGRPDKGRTTASVYICDCELPHFLMTSAFVL